MTDVLILRPIPGHAPGDIVPITTRLEKHVRSGNARVLPNTHEEWKEDVTPAANLEQPLGMHGTGLLADRVPVEADYDSASEDELEDEDTGDPDAEEASR